MRNFRTPLLNDEIVHAHVCTISSLSRGVLKFMPPKRMVPKPLKPGQHATTKFVNTRLISKSSHFPLHVALPQTKILEEQKMISGFSIDFSMARSPNRVLTPLKKKASKTRASSFVTLSKILVSNSRRGCVQMLKCGCRNYDRASRSHIGRLCVVFSSHQNCTVNGIAYIIYPRRAVDSRDVAEVRR